MNGIKDRVAVIGMGCTNFGERWDASSADLMVEAAYEAFADAGIEPKDVQAAWLGTVSSFRTGQPLAEALKPLRMKSYLLSTDRSSHLLSLKIENKRTY